MFCNEPASFPGRSFQLSFIIAVCASSWNCSSNEVLKPRPVGNISPFFSCEAIFRGKIRPTSMLLKLMLKISLSAISQVHICLSNRKSAAKMAQHSLSGFSYSEKNLLQTFKNASREFIFVLALSSCQEWTEREVLSPSGALQGASERTGDYKQTTLLTGCSDLEEINARL